MTHARLPHRALALGLALALALALVAGAHAQGDPTPGGTLVIGITTSPGHLNPAISTGSEVHTVADSIFNGLVSLDDQALPRPDLATAWTVNDDATVYTFTLAEGVRWHDGAPFTSADVRFTFEQVLLRYHARTRSGLEGRLAGIDTPDDRTVVFRFTEPYAPLLQQLNVTEAPILPRHVYEGVADVTTAAANLAPIGTGPFRFVAFDADEQVVLERNPDYFKEGLPYLDRLVFRIVPDATTRLLALERGELDFVSGVPASEAERIAASPALTSYAPNSGPGGGFCVMTMTFNLERELLADRAVREALAHAIDRQQLLDQVLYGAGRVATGPIHSGLASFYTDDVAQYPFDPQLAARLLDEAGYPVGADGVRFTFDFLHFPAFAKYGEVLRQNLAAVGVGVELVALDRAAFVTRVFTQRAFDTGVVSYCNNTDPAIGVARVYLSSNIGDIPFSNAGAYANPEVDRLFAEAATLADPGERAERYAAVQQVLTAELPYLWLVETARLSASAALVRGLEPWNG
ncbi:MAG: ABC transporter substrate-binding protein, partial [Trueperaceae bacterium]